MTSSQVVGMGVLLGVLLASALGVVYTKYKSRQIFNEIQKQEMVLDHYEVEWGQLQLELTTLAEHNRVELVAREKLKLVMPVRDKIIYLKP